MDGAASDTDDSAKDVSRKGRMRKEFESLRREMEIAQYATTHNGQYRRKMPRSVSRVRTKKRKLLEKSDAKQRAIRVFDEVGQQRLRGSKLAFEDEVIQGSMIFRNVSKEASKEDTDQDEYEDDGEEVYDDNEEEAVEDEEEVVEDDDNEGGEVQYYEDPDEVQDVDENDDGVGNDDEDEDPDEIHEDDEVEVKAAAPAFNGRNRKAPKPRKKRLMYRMRNFKSYRMAQIHGDALGAHARGQSRLAVAKLEQVAADAPTAPQVYSSLGLVYEGLLTESKRRNRQVSFVDGEGPSRGGTNPLPQLQQQINWAKKAYGSYHVAAVLCKKDFTLWVRAADTAIEIADLYTEAMLLSGIEAGTREQYRHDKRAWIEEARKDYTTADNLKPPGIDVPAKLASAQIELGNLSEALTLLTDLKNRSLPVDHNSKNESYPRIRQRNLFERSYRTWLLYADLMLRIGHECTQWNRGVHQNDNYMFRRWLRKYSQIFDWQERRLQALSLALEAAAGSNACNNLMQWAKQRVSIGAKAKRENSDAEVRRWHVDSYELVGATQDPLLAALDGDGETENIESKEDEVCNGSGDAKDGLQESPDPISTLLAEIVGGPNHCQGSQGQDTQADQIQMEEAKEELFSENRLELAQFDNETDCMKLAPGSEEAIKRSDARNALIQRHRAAVVNLVGGFIALQYPLNTVINSSDDHICDETTLEPLPMSASCATVCTIASELMKHCLGLELYKGGRLVGEAVSAYFKDRASMLERRKSANQAFVQKQRSTDEAVLLQFESYDEIREDGDEGDEAEVEYLSDDEAIDAGCDDAFIQSLKFGILPPELRFLYALCLLVEGGRRFLVEKSISAIYDLEDETDKAITDPIDTDIQKDALWQMFRRAMIEPLRRTSGYAFAADLLQKSGKEREWSAFMAPLFQKHLDDLHASKHLEQLLSTSNNISVQATLLKNQLMKIIAATARMQMNKAMTMADTSKGKDLASATIDHLSSFLHILWQVEEGGKLSSIGVEVVKTLASGFSILMRDATAETNMDDNVPTEAFLSTMRHALSFVSGVAIPDPFKSSPLADELSSVSWTRFPIPADWQDGAERMISARVYNLAIGCNVTLFSGWETDEFNLNLLRRRSGRKRFGINITGERVTGYMDPEAEAQLVEQWKDVEAQLPWVSPIDFASNLENVKETAWYVHAKQECESEMDSIASYGERDALGLFLNLSRLCLAAAHSTTSHVKDALIKIALSVLVPISQFCLDVKLWESSLGKAYESTSCIDEWKQLAASNIDTEENRDDSYVQTPKERRRRRLRADLNGKWIDPRGRRKRFSITNMVKIPISILLVQWVQEDTEVKMSHETRLDEALPAMRKVDVAMKHLRACFTEIAIEKACIQVAASLIDLVAAGHSRNPFLCLNQAATFASQGAKGGNNDEPFKRPLPDEKDCKPLDALVVLGRADCLQALQFLDEAIYLCSYVARVCRLHRDRLRTDLPWTPQWGVIGMWAYNVCVMIRVSVSDASQPAKHWEKDVIAELERGRADALAIKRTLLHSIEPSEMDSADESDSIGGDDVEEGDPDGSNQNDDYWDDANEVTHDHESHHQDDLSNAYDDDDSSNQQWDIVEV